MMSNIASNYYLKFKKDKSVNCTECTTKMRWMWLIIIFIFFFCNGERRQKSYLVKRLDGGDVDYTVASDLLESS